MGKDNAIDSIRTESYYAKKSDGFVYYYWRIVGEKTWNEQKTAMLNVPTVEMIMDVRKKALELNPPKPNLLNQFNNKGSE